MLIGSIIVRDHVEKNCCASVIRLVTKSLPHLGRSFSWPERAEASFQPRQQLPAPSLAPPPWAELEQSREFSSFMRDQIIFTLCRGRAARLMDWARSWGREWILDNIENLNKMFIPLLTSDTHVTITWVLISAQGLLLDRSFPYLNMYVLIYEQMKILILI